jgi:hypothetical protein
MFRFTIRDVLWLTIVVSLAVVWSVDRVNATRRSKTVGTQVERVRTVLNDARSAYWLSAKDFFQRRDGGFLPQEPDWAVAEAALDALAEADSAKEGGQNRTAGQLP